jgi:hypothetical protein
MKSFIKLTDFKKSELFEIFKIADSIEQYEGFLKGKTYYLKDEYLFVGADGNIGRIPIYAFPEQQIL